VAFWGDMIGTDPVLGERHSLELAVTFGIKPSKVSSDLRGTVWRRVHCLAEHPRLGRINLTVGIEHRPAC